MTDELFKCIQLSMPACSGNCEGFKMCEEQNFILKRYKLEPPDGGYGYAICISVIIVGVTTVSFYPCLGMIFNDIMIELKMGSTELVLLNGFSIVSFALSGYAAGPMSKMMSLRQISAVGTALNVMGSLGTVWAKSQPTFYLSQAISGIGCGFLYNISTTLINDYFLKKRLLAMSITQIFPAVGTMLIPIFVKWTLDEYGYRGTFLFMAGAAMQNIIATVLIQPVEWHMKKVPLTDEELEEQNTLISKSSKGAIRKEDKDNVVVIKMTINNGDQTVNESNDAYDKNPDNTISNDSKEQIGIWAKIIHTLDLKLLNDCRFLSAALGLTLCSFSDSSFQLLLPQALYSVHWSKDSVAWALTLYSFGDLASRIAIIIFNKLLVRIGNREIYMLGLVLTVVTKIGMLGSENVTVILVYLTIMGISRCTINTMFPIVLSDCVHPSLFAQALGISLLIVGISNLLLGPVIGAISDLTKSFSASFYILTSIFAITLLFWSIEMCYLRNQNKERTKMTKKSSKPK